VPRDVYTAELELADGAAVTADFEWRTELRPITGRVVDPRGEPVAGEGLRAAQRDADGEPRSVHATTRVDGGYELSTFGERAWTVSLSSVGEELERGGILPGTSGLDFVKPDRGLLRLLLVDEHTGRALSSPSGTSSILWWSRAGATRFQRCTLRDFGRALRREGLAELELPQGRVDVRVDLSADGYVYRELLGLRVGAEPDAAPLRVELAKGHTLRLRLRAADADEPPVPHEHTLFAFDERDAEAFDRAVASTDPLLARRRIEPDRAGAALLRGLGPGGLTLRVLPADLELEPTRIDMPSGEDAMVEVVWRRN
jgi:hypothetical protein